MSEPPVLRIVAGGLPTDEETAALTAVLSVVASARDDEHSQLHGRSRWRDSAHPAGSWAGAGWLARARQSALRRQQ